jgi:hypothetical protein
MNTPNEPRFEIRGRLLSSYFRKNKERVTSQDRAWLLYNFFKDRLIYASVDIPKIMNAETIGPEALTNLREYFLKVSPRYAQTNQNNANELINFFYTDHDLGSLWLKFARFRNLGLPKTLMPLPSVNYFGLLSQVERVTTVYNFEATHSQIPINKELINQVYQLFLEKGPAEANSRDLFAEPGKYPPEPIGLEEVKKRLESEPPQLRFPHDELLPYHANFLIVYWATRFTSPVLPRWISNYNLSMIKRCNFDYNMTSRLHHYLVYADPAVYPAPVLDEKLREECAKQYYPWQCLQLPLEYRFDIEVAPEHRLQAPLPTPGAAVSIDQPALPEPKDPGQEPPAESDDPSQDLAAESTDPGQELAAESTEPGQEPLAESTDPGQELAAESKEPGQE